MKKVFTFGLIGALGGLIGAVFGEIIILACRFTIAANDSGLLHSYPAIITVMWTAMVAMCLSLTLVFGQNRQLKRSAVSLRQNAIVAGAACLAGVAAGASAELVFRLLGSTNLPPDVGRLAAWTILGGLLAWGMAFFIPNLPRLRAALAGCVGGFVAAWVFVELSLVMETLFVSRLCGAAVLGLFVGSIVAAVEAAFREAWLEVLYGPGERTTVTLGIEDVSIGSDPKCTIFAAGAAPVAARYRLENGKVRRSDVPSGQVSMVNTGTEQRYGKLIVKVGAIAGVQGEDAASYSLRLSQRESVELAPGTTLTTDQIPGLDTPLQSAVAEVNVNPRDPRVLGLQNKSRQNWSAVSSSGMKKTIEPGKILAIVGGTRIDFGQVRGEIVARQRGAAMGGGSRQSTILLSTSAAVLIVATSLRAYQVLSRPASAVNAAPVIQLPPDEEPVEVEPPPEPPKIVLPEVTLPPVDPVQRISVSQMADGRFGVSTTSGNPDDLDDDNKQLTFSTNGNTNSTRIWIDGETPNFGGKDGNVVNALSQNESGTTVVQWESSKVLVTQTTTMVAGMARRMDAVQVTFRLQNEDSADHDVGLRVMIDSLIGKNDGVPFIVPGRPQIVTAPQTFRGQDIPDWIKALEVDDLAEPGVIAYLGLRPEDGERPEEVVLSHWPGEDAPWEYDRDAPFGEDTAIGLYYLPKKLRPGEDRLISFTYGVGSISSTATGNTALSLTAEGPFRSGGQFWVVALVQQPKPGQRIRLELPDGIALASSEKANEKVVRGSGSVAQVSWLLQIDRTCIGVVKLKANLLPGDIVEEYDVAVEPRDAKLSIVSKTTVREGRPFWVSALVQNARKEQTATLVLPSGLKLTIGNAVTKTVPSDKTYGQVDWLVQPDRGVLGQYVVTVRLNPDNVEESASVEVTERGVIE